MPATSEDDEFLVETEDVIPAHVEMQRMTGSFLHVFEETTLDRHIQPMVETKLVSLLETANNRPSNGGKTPFYQAVEKDYPDLSLEAPSTKLWT